MAKLGTDGEKLTGYDFSHIKGGWLDPNPNPEPHPNMTVRITPPETTIAPMQKMRHPLSEKFHKYLQELGDLHDRKQQDYGRDDDPFANVRSGSDWGVEPWVGAMIRLNDKVKRLQKLATKRGNLVNESAIDSFCDISVYALIARILYEESHK